MPGTTRRASIGRAGAPSSAGALPDLQATRDYLVETLETTLELLAGVAARRRRRALLLIASPSFTRRCTPRRSRCSRRRSASRAAWWRASRPTRRGRRCCFPATRWLLGSSAAGFRFDNEAEPHPVEVPEFEIDAQAVTWAQYGEFVEDGGYDERAHWSEAGWAWLAARGPAHAAPRRPDAPRRAAAPLRRARAGRRGAARGARQLARGRCLVPLGRPAPAERGRVGSGRAPGRDARLSLGRRPRVDAPARFGPIRASWPGRGATIRLPAFGSRQGPARRVVRDPRRPAQRTPARLRACPSATTASSAFAAAPPERRASPRGQPIASRDSLGARAPLEQSASQRQRPSPSRGAAASHLRQETERGHSHFPHRQRQGRDPRPSMRARCSCSSCASSCSSPARTSAATPRSAAPAPCT